MTQHEAGTCEVEQLLIECLGLDGPGLKSWLCRSSQVTSGLSASFPHWQSGDMKWQRPHRTLQDELGCCL